MPHDKEFEKKSHEKKTSFSEKNTSLSEKNTSL